MSERASATPPPGEGDPLIEARRTSDRPSGWQIALRGLPGHPLHPPCTDATIGMFVLAAGLAVIGSAGAIKEPAGKAMWLALIGGVVAGGTTPPPRLLPLPFLLWGG